jgi:hypothetical protein
MHSGVKSDTKKRLRKLQISDCETELDCVREGCTELEQELPGFPEQEWVNASVILLLHELCSELPG